LARPTSRASAGSNRVEDDMDQDILARHDIERLPG